MRWRYFKIRRAIGNPVFGDRKIQFVRLIAAASAAIIGSSALAGYTALTGSDLVLTPDGSTPSPQIGDAFTVAGGTFTSFPGDTAADSQVAGGDLNFYRYNLNGAVSSVDLGLGVVGYSGTYQIFYDLNLNGTPDEGVSVSSGTFAANAAFIPATNNAALTGVLTQTTGPSNPAFDDLSYGGSPVLYTGTYVGTNPGVSGTLLGALRQNALVPEPTTLAAPGALTVVIRRRR